MDCSLTGIGVPVHETVQYFPFHRMSHDVRDVLGLDLEVADLAGGDDDIRSLFAEPMTTSRSDLDLGAGIEFADFLFEGADEPAGIEAVTGRACTDRDAGPAGSPI